MAPTEGHGEDAAHTTTTTEAEHGSGGLPQFQFQHWGGQIAYLLVLFVILYVLIARVFTPRMRAVIDERANTIAGALETARQVQAEAEDQAKASAAEDAKVSQHVAQAEARIAAVRDAAMSNVATIAADTATAIVEKLTGKAPSAADVKAALARGGVA